MERATLREWARQLRGVYRMRSVEVVNVVATLTAALG